MMKNKHMTKAEMARLIVSIAYSAASFKDALVKRNTNLLLIEIEWTISDIRHIKIGRAARLVNKKK